MLKMGRRGSPRAHTLGKWSHGPQDPFKIPPRPQKHIVFFVCFGYIIKTPDQPPQRPLLIVEAISITV